MSFLPPDGEEADDADDHAGRRLSDGVQEVFALRRLPADEHQVAQGAGEEEDALQRQRHQEHVEVAVVAEAHAVTDPWAMMVEPGTNTTRIG